MSRRRRWRPVRGTGSRVDDPLERWALGALDLPGRAAYALARGFGLARPRHLDPASVREVLVLRLDRMGDVVMSLPALADLRAALPGARIRLAVGGWSEEVARSAPVDEVLVWNAPWVGRPSEGNETLAALAARARALRRERLDLAIDLQGDVRATVLMRLSGARLRVGYANTGGGWLLTQVVALDETVSWVEQNRRAVAAAFGPPEQRRTVDPLDDEDRGFALRLLANLALDGRRPLVGIHPSGGRVVKQWGVDRWGAVAGRLQRELGATVLVTGSAEDRGLAARLAQGLAHRPIDLTGRLTVRETLAVIGALDLFLSPDTGPMHLACAAGTPSVSVFGPSDPVRYFSGGEGVPGSRHVVVRQELWCSPCNLIRKPPRECAGAEGPECLRLVGVDEVFHQAARLLRDVGGYGRPS